MFFIYKGKKKKAGSGKQDDPVRIGHVCMAFLKTGDENVRMGTRNPSQHSRNLGTKIIIIIIIIHLFSDMDG